MWRQLMALAQKILGLTRRLDKHAEEIQELKDESRQTNADLRHLAALMRTVSERLLRVEVELQHLREQQATERENFRLQLENLIL